MKKVLFFLVLVSLLLVGCTSHVIEMPAENSEKETALNVQNTLPLDILKKMAPTMPAIAEQKVSGEDSSTAVDDSIETVVIKAYQFAYDPDFIEVDYGKRVRLTITSMDVGHGFALPDFGVNERIPPEDSVTVSFIADKKGEFDFFNSVYSGKGWKDMKGRFVVK